MESRREFESVKFDDHAQRLSDAFRDNFMYIADNIDLLISSRSRSLALMALEESFMWINKAISFDQGKREIPK